MNLGRAVSTWLISHHAVSPENTPGPRSLSSRARLAPRPAPAGGGAFYPSPPSSGGSLFVAGAVRSYPHRLLETARGSPWRSRRSGPWRWIPRAWSRQQLRSPRRRHGSKSLLLFGARARPGELHHATKFLLRFSADKTVQGRDAPSPGGVGRGPTN
jgi:hypothetical protein